MTGELSAFLRVVIIATMFVGRIGILNFFFSFAAARVFREDDILVIFGSEKAIKAFSAATVKE